MKIKYLCTIWGMDRPTLAENLNLIKDAGFDGVETQVSCGGDAQDRLGVLLERLD